MKKKLLLKHLFLLFALIVGSTSAWAQTSGIIWQEDWSSGSAGDKPSTIVNANATYAQSSDNTKLYDDSNYAGGTVPELFLAKGTTSSFTATINLGGKSGNLTLTFKTNSTNFSITSTTTGVSITGTLVKGENTFTINVPSGTESLVLVFTSTTSNKNSRLDDFMLTVAGGTPPTPTTYTVTYDCNGGTSGCPENLSGVSAGNSITLAAAPTKTDNIFAGWNDGTTTYDAGDSYTVNSNVTFTAQWTANGGGETGDESWVLTDLADLTEDDVFVIVGNDGSNNYALPHNNGSSTSPTAVAVTVEGTLLTSTVSNDIKWNLSGNATNGYTFYPDGVTDKWLYCNTQASSSSNNNVRIGTGNRKIFEIVSGNYLATKDDYTTRYVSVYNATDWRGYTNTTTAPTTIAFYKKVTSGAPTPSIIANNVSLAYDATSGEIPVTINNPVDNPSPYGAFTSADWISDVNYDLANSKVTFTTTDNTGNVARTATITINYNGVTKDVTVTQAAAPATLLTIADVRAQGTGNVKTQGIVTSCVGTTGYIQDATAAICVFGTSLTVGDEITVEGTLSTFNGLLEITNPTVTVVSSGNTVEPEVMTIAAINADYAGNNTKQGWLVKIENAKVTAVSGQNTTVAQGENTIVVRGIASTVEYAVGDVLTFTGNIGCYNAAQIVNPTDVTVKEVASIVVNPNSIEAPADGADGTITVTYNNITEVIAGVYFYDADGIAVEYDWIDAEINADNNVYYVIDANEGAARTAYMKVFAFDDEDNEVYSDLITITQAEYVEPFEGATYTLASSITPGKHYIIVGKVGEDVYAMGGQNNNNRAAVSVTENNDGTITSAERVVEFVISIPGDDGFYAIYDENIPGYLYASSNSSNQLKTQTTLNANGKWKITFGDGGVASIVAQGSNGRNVMKYNPSSNIFACYASENNQSDVYLYEKVDDKTTVVTISALGYATFGSAEAVDFSENPALKVYTAKVNDMKTEVELTEVASKKVPAGAAVLLQGSAGPYTAKVIDSADPLTNNELKLATQNLQGNGSIYVLNKVDDKVGFYKLNGTLSAGKAYLEISGSGAPMLAITGNEGTTGIVNVNRETITNNQYYTLDGRRVENPSNGIYIVNGKKVVIK